MEICHWPIDPKLNVVVVKVLLANVQWSQIHTEPKSGETKQCKTGPGLAQEYLKKSPVAINTYRMKGKPVYHRRRKKRNCDPPNNPHIPWGRRPPHPHPAWADELGGSRRVERGNLPCSGWLNPSGLDELRQKEFTCDIEDATWLQPHASYLRPGFLPQRDSPSRLGWSLEPCPLRVAHPLWPRAGTLSCCTYDRTRRL